jgi:hypothetical protein
MVACAGESVGQRLGTEQGYMDSGPAPQGIIGGDSVTSMGETGRIDTPNQRETDQDKSVTT